MDPEAGPVERLAWELRLLRERAGSPSYRALAKRAHYSASTLADAAKGERLPSLEVLLAYAQACGGERVQWELRWRAAVAAIEQHDAGPDDEEADGPCPYPGLAVFEAGDADVFHGRSELVKELSDSVEREPLTVVFGASGSGKSSLLRAGLIAGLGEDWHPVLLTPSQRPLAAAAAAVAPFIDADAAVLREQLVKDPGALDLAVRTWLAGQSDNARVLLVVDQFEEAYTLNAPEGERDAFLQALAGFVRAAGSRTRLVIGVRADFYPRCFTHPDLAAVLRSAAHLPVGPPSRDELAEIITAPAADAGVSVDGDLLQVVLGEAAGQPGALPLVAHALREAWWRREGAVLRLADYRATGGMRGAVAQTCERMYHEATEAQQQILRAVFLRLTALGEGTEDTRRRLPRTDLDGLAAPGEVDALLRRLAAARVLVLAQDTVEVAHEAVIRAWPRLRRWLDDDREAIRTHHRLTTAAQTWHDLNRDHAALYRGSQLATARAWAKEHGHALNTLEKEFLHGGVRAERRRAHLARSVTATLATLLVLALIAAGTAYQQRNDAEDQRRAAVSAQRQAQSRQLAARSDTLIGTDPDLASLLAVQAYRTSPTAEATASLYSAAALPLKHRLTATNTTAEVESRAVSVAFSPDGRALATGGADGTVRLWDPVTGRARTTLTGHNGGVDSVAFSPDGRTLLIGGDHGTVWAADTTTGHSRAAFTNHQEDQGPVVFSPDGRTLAQGGSWGAVRVWDIGTGQVRTTLSGGKANRMAFSPDGRTLATSDFDNRVRLWDATSGRTQTTLADRDEEVTSLTFSSDGRTLVTCSDEGTVRLWDAETGRARATFTGRYDGGVTAVAVSPDGRTVAAGGWGSTVSLWDTGTGRARATLTGHKGLVTSLAFSPDGHTLATGGDDGTARLWDTETGHTLTGQAAAVVHMAFSPDGDSLATASDDGSVRLWDTETGRSRATLADRTGSAGYPLVAFSPDGRTLASAVSISDLSGDIRVQSWHTKSGRTRTARTETGYGSPLAFGLDGRTLASIESDKVRLWDTETGRTLATLRGFKGQSAVFSPDLRTLATGSYDGTVRLWDTRTGRATFSDQGEALPYAFSADGRTLALGSGTTVRLQDPATGRIRATLTGHTGSVNSAMFSPDGRTLATGGDDSTVRLWDTETGRTRTILSGHDGPVGFLAFSPDGHTLASTSATTVHLWDIDLPGQAAALREICQAVGRDLTAEERSTYLPDSSSGPACPS